MSNLKYNTNELIYKTQTHRHRKQNYSHKKKKKKTYGHQSGKGVREG